MTNKKEIGKRLKEFAEANFSTLKEFAEAINISPGNLINNYFSGKSILGGEKLALLIKMGCDITWLLTGEGEAPVKPGFKEQVKKEYQKEEKKKDTLTEQALAIGLTEEEAEIIRKMRLVKGSKPILKQLLEGQIKIQEALNKFSNLATEDNKNPLLQTSKGQST